jgi:hypothetical protein
MNHNKESNSFSSSKYEESNNKLDPSPSNFDDNEKDLIKMYTDHEEGS